MIHDDPARPTIASRPAWAEAPQIVLPLLQLTPQPAADGALHWLVQFMFPSARGPNAFSWVGKVFEQGAELNAFLLEWYEGPEDAVRKHFALEPPRGKVWNIAPRSEIDGEPSATTSKTLSELGL